MGALSCWENAGIQHRTHILELLHKKNQIAGFFIHQLHPVIVWGLFRGWGDAFILALPAAFIGQSRLHGQRSFLIKEIQVLIVARLSADTESARRSNQLILKEINPEFSLERPMLKLKLQYFDHLMQRANLWKRLWCWERLRAREGGNRGWDVWMASLTHEFE